MYRHRHAARQGHPPTLDNLSAWAQDNEELLNLLGTIGTVSSTLGLLATLASRA